MRNHNKFAVGLAMVDMAFRAPDGDRAALLDLASAQADTRLEDILDKINGRNWFSFSRVEGTIYARIGNDLGFVGRQTFDDFKEAIGDAPSVELFFDSNGGDSDLALKIAALLVERNVEATITGRCCSAATTIFLAASRRLIHPAGRIMIHKPSIYTVGGIERHEMSIRALGKLNARLVAWIASRTGQTPATVADWLTPPDRWFDVQQSIDAGLVHEITDCPDIVPPPAEFTAAGGAFPGCDFPDAALVFDLLRAAGRVRAENKTEFGRKLHEWWMQNVYE